eukprot:2482563-Amphidinium_carterae.1
MESDDSSKEPIPLYLQGQLQLGHCERVIIPAWEARIIRSRSVKTAARDTTLKGKSVRGSLKKAGT